MDGSQAARDLELIRTMMERTVQYQLLTARAGLIAGSLAVAGALTFLFVDAHDPAIFASIWGGVFAGAVLTTTVGTIYRGRQLDEPIWSRPCRAVVLALAPSLFAALTLTIFFFARGDGLHLWLPAVWMLCYGQGALATAAYAPAPIRTLGLVSLLAGGLTLALGPDAATVMMGVIFGLGHVALGTVLLATERNALRLHRSVA